MSCGSFWMWVFPLGWGWGARGCWHNHRLARRGERAVWGSVGAGVGVGWCGVGERFFLEYEVGV